MKFNLCVLTFLLTGFLIQAQNLTEREFRLINEDLRTTIYSINEPKDLKILAEKFNLTEKDSLLVASMISKEMVDFSNEVTSKKNYILPFHVLSDSPDEIRTTLFSMSVQPKRADEEFHRGKYDFILITISRIENGTPVYSDSVLLADPDSINKWFLKIYPTYLEATRPIFTAYKYVPPPPPRPPVELK